MNNRIMKQNAILIWLMITFLMISCQNKPKRFLDRLDECSYDDKTCLIENELYPFDINNSNRKLILDNCFSGVKIDSSINIVRNNDTDLIISLTDKISEISYYHMNYRAGEKTNYKLYQYSITTNVIKFKNNIEIGMQRDEFFKNIKRSYVDCDTFEIYIGLTGFYYDFVFRNDSLIRIDRKMELK